MREIYQFCRKLWVLIEPNHLKEKNNNGNGDSDIVNNNDNNHYDNNNNNYDNVIDYINNHNDNDNRNDNDSNHDIKYYDHGNNKHNIQDVLDGRNYSNENENEKKKININYWFTFILPKILKRNKGRDMKHRKRIYVFIQVTINIVVKYSAYSLCFEFYIIQVSSIVYIYVYFFVVCIFLH
jgi:hypothetical protein